MRRPIALTHDSRGFTLVEMLIAIIVLAVGILAVGRMFPAGTRAQVQDRLLTGANSYCQEKLEDLSTRQWADTSLSVGRHPSASGTEVLGTTQQWQRFYVVTQMAAPMDNLKKVDVTVTYSGAGLQSARSIVATTYMRK